MGFRFQTSVLVGVTALTVGCGGKVLFTTSGGGGAGGGATTSNPSTTTTSTGAVTSTSTGTGGFCGGIVGQSCDSSSYCSFALAGTSGNCGFDDAQGQCLPKPQNCTTDCPGVCGCDGNFYCNACTAQQQGFDVDAQQGCALPD